MKILLIEDEKALAQSVEDYFRQEKYICETVQTFTAAQEKINLYKYDCIIVDIGLPDGTGLNIIRELKQLGSDTGIIIISARNSLTDKISGLETGADDYLTKPFHLSELNARINSIIRRRSFSGQTEIRFNEIVIQPENKEVMVNDEQVVLTRTEYDLLIYFLSNKNRVLTRESIAEHLWGDNMDLVDSYDFLYTHMKNLRKKLVDKKCTDYIKTVYGIGYKFSEHT
jgi:DNA-binding response OmpR family regulator